MTEDKPKRAGRGLGRGLSALLGDTPLDSSAAPADIKGTVQVAVSHMQSGRYQPRMEFDQDALQDLAESIRAKGILQPILVRPLPEDPTHYEIIAGERRWRAAQLAQVHTVPVLIRDFSDREAAEVALIENLQRRDLSPLEEAEGYRRLMNDFARSQEDLAQALGKSRSHVANMMRLLALPEPVKIYLRDGRISAGHARALLNAEEPAFLAEQVVSKGLNVRQTEKLATDKGGVKTRKPRAVKEKDADTLALERDLARVLGLKVEVDFQGRGGHVTIHYETLDQLDDILYRLNNPTDRRREAAEDGLEDTDDLALADDAVIDEGDMDGDSAAFAASFGRIDAAAAEEEAPETAEEAAGIADGDHTAGEAVQPETTEVTPQDEGVGGSGEGAVEAPLEDAVAAAWADTVAVPEPEQDAPSAEDDDDDDDDEAEDKQDDDDVSPAEPRFHLF